MKKTRAGKVALITGVCISARTTTKIDATALAIQKAGGQAIAVAENRRHQRQRTHSRPRRHFHDRQQQKRRLGLLHRRRVDQRREDIVPLALFLGDTTHHRPDGAEF